MMVKMHGEKYHFATGMNFIHLKSASARRSPGNNDFDYLHPCTAG